MRISLILVTYNRADYLNRLLNSIMEFNWEYQSFLIIDNCSNDDTASVINNYKPQLNIEYIHSDENIGHGAGIALGLKKLYRLEQKPNYVVFLEDDSVPQLEYLEFLVKAITKTPFSMLSSGGYKVGLGSRTNLYPNKGELLESDFVLFDGAIANFDDLIKVGFPIEDWFMMFDDFEYCYRLRKAGLKLGVVNNPYIEILHEGWGGGKSYSYLWRAYFQSRNYILFVKTHFSFWNLFDCLILQSKRLIGGGIRKGGLKVTKMRLMGIRAGIFGRKGRSLDLKSLKEI